MAKPFSRFGSQLRAILGIHPLPAGVTSSDPTPISQWQVDAILRHRILENVRGSIDTISSIVKLVDRIQGMPVGESVKEDVEKTLDALEEVGIPLLPKRQRALMLPSCAGGIHRQISTKSLARRYASSLRPRCSALLQSVLQPRYGSHALLPRGAQVRSVYASVRAHCRSAGRRCYQGDKGVSGGREEEREDGVIVLDPYSVDVSSLV